MRIEEFNPNVAEIAEEVLLGPQADVIERINNFNSRYGTTIKSTKTFRWSPGVGKELQKIYKSCILDWDKKYSGVYQFFNRIDNRLYYHRSMKQTLNQINDLMTDFRHQGITFQNNADLVVETFNNLKNKALEELEAVKQLYSDQDIQVNLEVYERDEGGYYYRYEFAFPNPIMSIDSLSSSGSIDHLVDIKLYPIVLKGEIDFIQHLNTTAGTGRSIANCSILAQVLAPSDTVYHPYIFSRNQRREWYNVCLGDLAGDINTALSNFNIVAAATLLMQWTTQYTVNRTHPHNRPSMSYYGLPKYIKDQENSEAYLAAFPHNPNACGVPTAIEKIEDNDTREIAITKDNTCNSIDCQLKESCSYWNNVINTSQERLDNIGYLSGDYNTEYIHSILFSWRGDNDEVIREMVTDTMERLCEHDRHEDECEECLDAEIMQRMHEEARQIEDSMTDEERIIAWYERNITERSR